MAIYSVFFLFWPTVCLKAAMRIVERIDEFEARNDVVQVMRTISQIVNSMDADNGVLLGSWEGKYPEGK